MDPLELSDIAEMCGGELRGDSVSTSGMVSKDTRTIGAGDIYLGIRGDNHDGNAFAVQAAEKGAAGAILDRTEVIERLPKGFPVIVVENSLEALHKLAGAWRDRLSLRVVCITGSSGKTSTKEFASSVLSVRNRVVKTEGNLNNHIGLPLSILSATSSHTMAVWEIGMNHPGEIAPLAKLARPDIVIITNIGVAHIEYMGTREAIAAEKRALAEAAGEDGVVILPSEDEFAGFLGQGLKARVVFAGLESGTVTATDIETTLDGSKFNLHEDEETVAASLPVPGLHMVRNALLAVAAGLEAGMSLEECAEGLASARLVGGRLGRKTIRGITILDDTYNANPDSMIAALTALKSIPGTGRRIAVLGRMGELGDYATEGYRRVGDAAAETVDALITVGAETTALSETARKKGLSEIFESKTTADAANVLRQLATSGDLVLVKGSRAAGMENVITNFSN